MNTPKSGQKVWVLPIGNRKPLHKQAELFEAIVTFVGRKYFHVETSWGKIKIEFHLDSWFQKSDDYIPNYRAYESQQDRWDEKESDDLRLWIQHREGYDLIGKASLAQLRAIRNILVPS